MHPFFKWASERGIRLTELAARLGYSYHHVYLVRRGEREMNRDFAGRAVLAFGEPVRAFFLDLLDNTMTVTVIPATTSEAQP